MKVLFAVQDEQISTKIVKEYQRKYKEIISYKNIYYFNAILKELQRDKTYDRIVIDEELEEFNSNNYEQKDKFIFDKLDDISDEAINIKGQDIPIILICSERRTKSEDIFVKLFGLGIYNAIIGNDRSTEEVCRLIERPRSKKQAKIYYKIDSEEVQYKPENENDVSEEEMQNILMHFKRLGKNEAQYADSFSKIIRQYNQEQIKIIIKILPLNVRAVLEETSPEYQKIVARNGNMRVKTGNKQEEKRTVEKLLNADNKSRMTKPVVIPSTMKKSTVKKLTVKKPVEQYNIEEFDIDDAEDEDNIEEISKVQEIPEVVEEKPKRRGRPKKNPEQQVVETKQIAEPKRRGRPKKVNTAQELVEEKIVEEPKKVVEKEEITELPMFDDEEDDDTVSLPGFDDNQFEDDEEEITELPGFDDDEYEEEEVTELPGFNDNQEDEEEVTELPGFNDNQEDEGEVTELPGFNEEEYEEETTELPGFNDENYEYDDDNHEIAGVKSFDEIKKPKVENRKINSISSRQYERNYDDYSNFDNLLSADKKVVAFVGTSKNGTSFIVNNVAQYLSMSGINTAILDTTQNKNSYYIYTKNEEDLRNKAANSIPKLIQGNADGIKANQNLSVYTSVPGQDEDIQNVGPVLDTLVKNHSAILIDCDFNTPIEYFDKVQEIYLVQSMDVLTIQPLTAFLRELKAKNIIEQSKIRIIINKSIRLRGISAKNIIGGMAFYNDPEMSFMTELFDRNTVKYLEMPFDEEVYAIYLEGIVECEITINKYPKNFGQILKELANMVYPVLPSTNNRKPEKKKRGYEYSTGFSSSVNNTLNDMKRRY